MKRIYLSLGSNLGNREEALRTAILKLHTKDLAILRISSIYETEAVDVRNQPDFLNLVVEADTDLLPIRLLHRVARIEIEMGRRRTRAKGPRTIDIDILLHGRFTVDTAELKIPHPRMTQRRFVLEPLAELVPDLRHPVTRQTIRELLVTAPRQFLRRTSLQIDIPGSPAER